MIMQAFYIVVSRVTYDWNLEWTTATYAWNIVHLCNFVNQIIVEKQH